MSLTFRINTLHRGKYMLSFFILLFLFGGTSTLIPIAEIYKIIIVLCTIPIILYYSVRISQQPSTWTLRTDSIVIKFGKNTQCFFIHDIDHIRSLTRSGGNLYAIYLRKGPTKRYWRNKLFQKNDDHLALHQAFEQTDIEYFKF